jgi:hypothetical protein
LNLQSWQLRLTSGTAHLLPGRTRIEENSMDWEGLTKEFIQLGLPLLVIKGLAARHHNPSTPLI